MATDYIGGHDLDGQEYWKPAVQINGAWNDEIRILYFAMQLKVPANSVVLKISPCHGRRLCYNIK